MQTLKQEGLTNGQLRDLRIRESCSFGEGPVDTTGEPHVLFVRKNSMRNKPCGCGSGKKFKKCCWSKFNGVSL